MAKIMTWKQYDAEVVRIRNSGKSLADRWAAMTALSKMWNKQMENAAKKNTAKLLKNIKKSRSK